MKRTLLVIFSLMMSVAAFATEDQFEVRKAAVLSGLDQRISNLQGSRDCVKAATDRDAFKACREKDKANRDNMVTSRKAERLKQMDSQIKKMQERREKMKSKG